MMTSTPRQMAEILRERKLEYLVQRPESLHDGEIGLFLTNAKDRSESDFCFVEAPASTLIGMIVQAQRRVSTAKAATFLLGHLPKRFAAKQVVVIEGRLETCYAALDMAMAFLYATPWDKIVEVSGGARQVGGAAVVAAVKKIEHSLACLILIAEQHAGQIEEAITAAGREPEDRQRLDDVLAEIRQAYPE